MSASSTSTNVSCFGGATGAIDLTATGGTAAYSFNWGGGITTEDLNGLSAGTYTVTVTDANGCSTTSSAIITQPVSGLNVSGVGTNVSCSGSSTGTITLSVSGGTAPYSFDWGVGVTTQNISGLVAGTYTVTVTDNNGCINVSSVTVGTNSGTLSATAGTTAATCLAADGSATAIPANGNAPYIYLWNNGSTNATLNNLTAGTYNVTVTDTDGCTTVATATVTALNGGLNASANASNAVCTASNGSIDLTLTGGTTPYSYNWSNATNAEDPIGLSAGTYTVTATDVNGCTAVISSTVGTDASNISVSATSTDVTSGNDGAIDITVSGATAPITYLWSNGATTEDLNGLNQGNYTVTVTDGNGCDAVQTVTVNATVAVSLTTASSWNANIFPNPAEFQTTVAVELNAVSNVRIRLVNSLGQIIQAAEYNDVISVQHILNITDLPAAIYMVEISANGISKTMRLVITRK